MKKDRILVLNVISSVVLQIVLVINGFVLPRLILNYFGSEVNGLVSSLNQFLGYIQLLEGGLSGVILSTLYKPLAEHDSSRINTVVKTAQSFFRKIGIAYICYAILVGVIYPLVIKSSFSFTYIFLLTVILTITLFTQYYFSLPYRLLLQADQKLYIVSISQIIITVVNLILAIISLKIYPSIHILKFVGGVMFFVQPVIFYNYVKKHYKLNLSVNLDNTALSQRWDGFGQNLAYFIHTNTDAVVISFFMTLNDVSIYTIYFLVANSLKNLIIAVSTAIIPKLGLQLHGDNKEHLSDSFGKYEYIMLAISSLAYSCAICLTTPFVMVYTSGVSDADYYQPLFCVILMLAELVYCMRDPYVSITYAAGHFKQTAKYAYTEAMMNIVISVILIQFFGIIGVAIGTLVSMLYRLIAHVLYSSKNILNRNPLLAFKSLGTFILCPIIAVLGMSYLTSMLNSLLLIVIAGFVLMVVFAMMIIIISAIFHRSTLRFVKEKILPTTRK